MLSVWNKGQTYELQCADKIGTLFFMLEYNRKVKFKSLRNGEVNIFQYK